MTPSQYTPYTPTRASIKRQLQIQQEKNSFAVTFIAPSCQQKAAAEQTKWQRQRVGWECLGGGGESYNYILNTAINIYEKCTCGWAPSSIPQAKSLRHLIELDANSITAMATPPALTHSHTWSMQKLLKKFAEKRCLRIFCGKLFAHRRRFFV